MNIKIFSVSEMVAAEKAADAHGVSYAEMMEEAGRLSAETIIQHYPITDARILILVGPGNNGGDGLVAGRYLAQAGADVAFYLFAPRNPLTDNNYAKIMGMGLFVAEAALDQRFRVLRTRLRVTDILVDALLGTGVSRPISGPLADLMQQLQAGLQLRNRAATPEKTALTAVGALPASAETHNIPVIAIDCPSGLNCDTGALDPLTIPATTTVTFAGPKRGHFAFPGAAAVGNLVVADIHIDPALEPVAAVALSLTTAETIQQFLPPRPRDGHKGTFGTALIAAGSADYFGAPLLAGRGAYRAGAGLVALAVPRSVRATVAGQLPEATYPSVSAEMHLDPASVDELANALKRASAVLVGPGLGSAERFVATLLAHKETLPPLVIDADGLNCLAGSADWVNQLPPNSILTPHPGEMARLMNMPLTELKTHDRVELALKKAAEWHQIVLLKGAYTIVAAPDGRAYLLPFANPTLSVAGSGDVLSGIIVGLLAQGMEPFTAAVAGGFIHGAAGQLAAEKWGSAGVLAAELAGFVPEILRRLRPQTI